MTFFYLIGLIPMGNCQNKQNFVFSKCLALFPMYPLTPCQNFEPKGVVPKKIIK